MHLLQRKLYISVCRWKNKQSSCFPHALAFLYLAGIAEQLSRSLQSNPEIVPEDTWDMKATLLLLYRSYHRPTDTSRCKIAKGYRTQSSTGPISKNRKLVLLTQFTSDSLVFPPVSICYVPL